jgi:large subunit ribosomal protein L25
VGENSLAVELREHSGKGVARKLRAAGRVPAVLYGRGSDSVTLSLDPSSLETLLRRSDAGLNTLIDLEGASQAAGKTVLVKELQRDPVRGRMLHADLYEVDPNQTIVVSVPLHVVGSAPGVAISGGLLDNALREVELECLVRMIPDEIQVDVSGMELGDSLHVRDLALPDGVSLRTDADLSVVSVVAPSVAVEEPEVPEEAEVAEGEEAAPAPDEGEAGEAEPKPGGAEG